MPLTNREALQLGLLLLCVPLQYILSTNFSTTVTERSQIVFKAVNEVKRIRDSWLSIDFRTEYLKFVSWFINAALGLPQRKHSVRNEPVDKKTADKGDELSPDQSPAKEVLKYRERHGSFGMSRSVRSDRPQHLRFRIGQVVRHKTSGHRAVIIGWDLKAKVPEVWLDKIYGENKILSNWPHYALLIDERDHKSDIPVNGYVVQSRLELLKNTEIVHAHLDDYFLYFDGAQYIPKEKLRKLYPKD